jgi:predicted pyridoxine 5'-phosphate oxidase superfamily flavin-nucleotide-binding protein
MVPGVTETLRVNGRAGITIDSAILEKLAANGKPAQAAIRVEAEEVYFQCGKALIRSKLWDSERHIARGTLTPFAKVLADHCKIGDESSLANVIEEDYKTALY